MPWIQTEDLTEDSVAALSPHDAHQIYNGLDSLTTFEIWEKLTPLLAASPPASATYHFKMAMHGPALCMMRRGILIDRNKQHELLSRLIKRREFLEARFFQLTQAVCGQDLNPRSPVALQPMFYNYLKIPPIEKRFRGETKRPMDLEVLEKLLEYPRARPLAKLVMEIRGIGKQVGVLRSGVDDDSRMRTSYNVASTETERWSSSENAFRTGTNFQNITDELREPFVADPGKKLAYVDLSQAESFVIGLGVYRCTGDETYLVACESGDLHTGVCRTAWANLEWPSDPKLARIMADQPFYRWFTYRDMSKRLGHATNLLGKPFGLAKKLRMNQEEIAEFQRNYLSGFKINKLHQDIIRRLQIDGVLTTLLGNRRQFFGRLYDEAVWREAVAFEPQSVIGQLLNSGMYRVWKREAELPCELLAQVHDAILVQYPEELEDEILPQIQALMQIPLSAEHNGVIRSTLIPNEAAVGWNWAKKTEKNPDGLEKWSGHDDRKRQGDPTASILDRWIS